MLLLHGLAGYGGEWDQTGAWLAGRYRVAAPDARGHGSSDRHPADVSRQAHVADAVATIKERELAPAVVVGQSLGGITAMLLAARHPDLVRALVVIEASPAGGDPDLDTAVAEVAASLRRWPVPFASRNAAIEFFGGEHSPGAEVWADGLEQREDGLWPRFDVDVLARTLHEAVARDHWTEWEQIRCPTLVVRGGQGTLDTGTAQQMLQRLPRARLADIPEAGHDLHLDRAEDWRTVLEAFLADLPR